ncbi:MAG: glycosyltransferase [Bacteroidetes bacterium]|nr:glycosyltransferase [Bacteroidota bacterium]
MIVGSDELWKAGYQDDPYSIPYPNPYWGSGIRIKKVALAVSTGSVNFLLYPEQTRLQMRNDLLSFDQIYVRDRKSANDLETLGIQVNGLLPDPTFAIDFEETEKLPTDDVNPEEWFSSFSNLDFVRTDRMHKLLACLRGGTPCLSYDKREKSLELKMEFGLPDGSESHIKENWPYEFIAKKCQNYREQWITILKILQEKYGIQVSALTENISVPLKREKPASSTYMFDCYRTGRLLYPKGGRALPVEIRRTRLPNSPPYSPESTAVFDRKGNMYFGCHDGNFYSLDPEGKIRWSYSTEKKIYSSPVLIPNSKLVCFAGGDGILYCLDFNGKLIWNERIGKNVTGWLAGKIQDYYRKHFHTLHEVNRIATANSWASPNILSDRTICVCGYVLGLSAFHPETGKLKWRLNLGKPSAHLTGVTILEDYIYAVAQQGKLLKVSSNGHLIWKRKLKTGYNAWGNPSIDRENNCIYVSVSRRENSAIIYSYDSDGNQRWRQHLPEAARGTVSISYENYVICCGFKGNMYFLEKATGHILKKISVTGGKMWTSASIDPNGYIFIPVIDPGKKSTGRICCYDKSGQFVWDFEMGKGHSVPVIDAEGRLYVGSWTGEYICLQTDSRKNICLNFIARFCFMSNLIKEKIIIVIGTLSGIGGAERQAILLAKYLRDTYHYNVCILAFSGGKIENTLKELSLPYYIFPFNFLGTFIKKIFPLVRLTFFIRSLNPDYIIPFITINSKFIGLIWKFTGARFACWNQRDEGREIGGTCIEKLSAANVPVIISNSWEGRDALVSKLGISADKIEIINNGVLLPETSVDPDFWRNKLGFGKEEIVISMIASIYKYKDHKTLLYAWQIVLDEFPEHRDNLKLVFAGSFKKMENELKIIAFDLRIANSLFFTGSTNKVTELINESLFVVHSSNTEGCPNAVLEAMAEKKAVIGTNISGIRQALGDQYSTICLSEPDNPKDLASKICYFLRNRHLLPEIGMYNYHRISTEFNIDKW